ncbi:MAG: hypothetical protein Q9196_006924 [Gyalolechia fulgens]
MVKLLDLDADDAFDPFARSEGRSVLQTPFRIHQGRVTKDPEDVDTSNDNGNAAQEEDRPNPNINGFSAALGCYPDAPNPQPRSQHPARPLPHLPSIPRQPPPTPDPANPSIPPLLQRLRPLLRPAIILRRLVQRPEGSRQRTHRPLRAGHGFGLPALRESHLSQLRAQAASAVSVVGTASEALSDMLGDAVAAAVEALARSVYVRECGVSVCAVRDRVGGRGYELPADMDLEDEV